MGLLSFLADAFDAVYAPASAFDTHSSAHCEDLTHSMTTTTTAYSGDADAEPAWHNGFGTLNDHQVPAESGDLFQSSDWSSGGCGSSFGDDW